MAGKKLVKQLERFCDAGPLCLRAAIGVIFIAHGAQKLFGLFGGAGLQATGQFFAQIGFQPGLLWAAAAGATEFFGGLAVLVGFSTRLAAFGLAAVMAVAAVKVHLANGFFMNFAMTPGVGHGIEYNLALLGGSLALVFGGPGKCSIDAGRCGSSCKVK